MKEDQRKDILCCYELVQAAIRNIGAELNGDNIIGRKTSFEYIDAQLDFMYDTIEELTNKLKESES